MRATMSMKPGPQDALTPPGHAFMALQTAVGWPCPRRWCCPGSSRCRPGRASPPGCFYEIPPAAVTGPRLWTSAVAIAVIAGRRLAQAFGDLAKRRAWAELATPRPCGRLPASTSRTAPPSPSPGADGYFGGTGELSSVRTCTRDECSKTPTAPYPAGALCCNSGRGVAIGTATEIVALQHQHSGGSSGPHRRRAIRESDNGPLSRPPVVAIRTARVSRAWPGVRRWTGGGIRAHPESVSERVMIACRDSGRATGVRD